MLAAGLAAGLGYTLGPLSPDMLPVPDAVFAVVCITGLSRIMNQQPQPDSKPMGISNKLCVQSDCIYHDQLIVSFMSPQRQALCIPDGPRA